MKYLFEVEADEWRKSERESLERTGLTDVQIMHIIDDTERRVNEAIRDVEERSKQV